MRGWNYQVLFLPNSVYLWMFPYLILFGVEFSEIILPLILDSIVKLASKTLLGYFIQTWVGFDYNLVCGIKLIFKAAIITTLISD